jgi:hypothetical protein
LNGDAAELRLALGEANLGANDMAIAQRALTAMENISTQEAKMLAERYGLDFANTINHAFGKEVHRLDLLARNAGSAEKAFLQVQTQIDSMYLLSGQFARTVNVGGTNVTVRGFVQDGIVKIRTIFVK